MDTMTEITAQQKKLELYYISEECLVKRIGLLQHKIKTLQDYSNAVPEDVKVTTDLQALNEELERLQAKQRELVTLKQDFSDEHFSCTAEELKKFEIEVHKIIVDNRPAATITIQLTPDESAILKRLMYTAVKSAKILEHDTFDTFSKLQISIYNQINKQFNHDNTTR